MGRPSKYNLAGDKSSAGEAVLAPPVRRPAGFSQGGGGGQTAYVLRLPAGVSVLIGAQLAYSRIGGYIKWAPAINESAACSRAERSKAGHLFQARNGASPVGLREQFKVN